MKTLFEPPLAHRDDPQTSYAAADKLIKSGKLRQQEQEVYDEIDWQLAVYKKSDFTAKEIADKWSLISGNYNEKYYTIQRRLSGLHVKGLIERTGEKRNGCMVWRLK